jgi:hypothetical protein
VNIKVILVDKLSLRAICSWDNPEILNHVSRADSIGHPRPAGRRHRDRGCSGGPGRRRRHIRDQAEAVIDELTRARRRGNAGQPAASALGAVRCISAAA